MKVFSRLLAYLALLALLAFPVLIYVNAQALSDWWQLRNYEPTAAISELATQDTMTEYARHVFYVNHPGLEPDVANFRSDCHEAEKTIVLGCYHSDQLGIFLFDVSNSRLKGVEQVTAAHEMLHAAYDRLSDKDKSNVNNLLMDYYNNHLHNRRVKDTIKAYEESEPNDLVNEMHSIFGTEIAELPSALDAYYSKYFTDRSKVAAFADNYQSEFTHREAEIKADDATLAQMKAEIEADEQSLQSQLIKIDSDREKLDSLRDSRQFSEYNQSVAGFNNEIAVYNNGVDQLRRDIVIYNRLVKERNSIADELASLTSALDTRLTTQPAQ